MSLYYRKTIKKLKRRETQQAIWAENDKDESWEGKTANQGRVRRQMGEISHPKSNEPPLSIQNKKHCEKNEHLLSTFLVRPSKKEISRFPSMENWICHWNMVVSHNNISWSQQKKHTNRNSTIKTKFQHERMERLYQGSLNKKRQFQATKYQWSITFNS